MISTQTGIRAERIFGPNYPGFVKQGRFDKIRTILSSLSLPTNASILPNRLYSHLMLEFLFALKEAYCEHIDLAQFERARTALLEIPASPSTFSFVTNSFNRAYKRGVDETQAVRNVISNLPAILISTTRVSYPSTEGKALIQGMRGATSAEDQAKALRGIIPVEFSADVDQAARAGFNAFNIIEGSGPTAKNPPDEDLLRYILLSKTALDSFAYALSKMHASGPDPLWVFLLRDAHLLYLLSENTLPGEKLELDVSRFSLATTEEIEFIFNQRGYDPGTRKGQISIASYAQLLQQLGDNPATQPAPSSSNLKAVRQTLVNRSNTDYDPGLTSFLSAQEALAKLTIPKQISQLLAGSGIIEAAMQGRPIVFIDTGYRGSLPLLLQSGLARILEPKGKEPLIYSWLDYVVDSLAQRSFAHQSGPWRVSPLDGLVYLNRFITPDFRTDVHTTPFDALKQSERILDPLDGYVEELRLVA